jgi:predicted permease
MNWLQRLLRGARMEKDLDKELRFHFEEMVTNKVDAGMSETEARRTTRLEFGGLDQVKEDCRESRGTLWIASILQDLRFGARLLARSPGFAATAIAVLALGIGVSTLAFSLYNLIALQMIPVRDAATIVSIQRRSPENINPNMPYVSIAYFRDHAKTLSAVMATMGAGPMVMNHDDQRVNPSLVTANYFSELGTTAAAGRLFDPVRENSEGAVPVAVVSYRLWQLRFHGDASIVGRTITLGGKTATVIGVTPKLFAGLGTGRTDVWLPLAQHSYFFGGLPLEDPKFDGMTFMSGRLAPGVSAAAAAKELLALSDQQRKIYPDLIWDHQYIVVEPGAHFMPVGEGSPLLAMAGTLVLLILAVACGNLSGLLMARGVSRQKEIQMRLSLGARRMRIVRQLLTESVLLGLLGSAAALPFSYAAVRMVLLYSDAPEWMSAAPDWRVLLFTAAMGFVAAIFFGVLPMLQMVRRKSNRALWQQSVVCAQVGASCVLLILAGLLVRATLHTLYTDPGFGYQQVLSIDPKLHEHGYTPAAARNYLDQLETRLRSVPGVQSVSMAMSPPLVNEMVMITSIDVNGKRVMIYPNWVGPDFRQTMEIPLLRGRFLKEGEKHAVVLSESLARKRWPNEDPIGKPWKDSGDTVVGVVGNTRAMEMNNTDATELYVPPADDSYPNMSVLVRTAGAPGDLTPAIKQIANSIDPKIFPSLTPLKDGYLKNVHTVEQIAGLISLLGGLAVCLAVVGLLGLVSYAVSQRTREIAIRLALGARHGKVFSAVLHRFLWPVAAGLVAGVGLTAGLSQVLRRVLYGVSGLDPLSYAGAMMLLVGILVAAALLPIRRALRLDVARVLHTE